MKSQDIHFGSRNGQAVVFLIVAMGIFMMGAIGLAIDGGQMYAQRQMAQAAADAAAGAGIMSILKGTNATSTYTFATGTPPLASYVCTTSDGRTPCVYARDNGFGATAADTVTLSYPATVSGVTLMSVTVPAFTVTVQRTLDNGLIRFVGGPAQTTISAKATAGITGTVSNYCMIILKASGAGTFQAGSGASLVLSGCGLAVNSANASAAEAGGGASVSASVIDVKGGYSTTTPGCCGTFTPVPNTGAAVVTDPFASLPALTPGTCLYGSMYTPPAGTTTLYPGTYCGGISVYNTSIVIFSAGNYIIKGGGITFAGSGAITGSGVTFYLTGTNATYASVLINNGADVTLSAPTTGTYTGVLFYQDRSITSASNASFTGGANMALTGSLYFPTTSVTYSNGTSVSGYTGIVAKQASFTGGARIKYDPTGLKTGLLTKSVALVQ